MKVDGIEPLVMNRILEKPNKLQVVDAEKATEENPIRQEQRGRSDNPVWSEESYLKQLELGVARLNNTVKAFNLSLRFQIHQESKRCMVQVIDTSTQEVIREMPPERLLNVVAQIQNLIGILLDEKR